MSLTPYATVQQDDDNQLAPLDPRKQQQQRGMTPPPIDPSIAGAPQQMAMPAPDASQMPQTAQGLGLAPAAMPQTPQQDPHMAVMDAAAKAKAGLGARPTDPNTVQGAHHGFRKALDVLGGTAIGALTFNPAAGIGAYRMMNRAPLHRAQDQYDANEARYNDDFNTAQKIHTAEQGDEKISNQMSHYQQMAASAEERAKQADERLAESKRDHEAHENIGKQNADTRAKSVQNNADYRSKRLEQINKELLIRAAKNTGNASLQGGLSVGQQRALRNDPEWQVAHTRLQHAAKDADKAESYGTDEEKQAANDRVNGIMADLDRIHARVLGGTSAQGNSGQKKKESSGQTVTGNPYRNPQGN